MAKELDIDKMLQAVDKGKGPGTLGSQPKFIKGYTLPSPQPKQEPMPPPKSNAPKGMGNAVKGDLGYYRGIEAGRAFSNPIKKAGRTGACAKPLTYRKPAIEGGEGPRAV